MMTYASKKTDFLVNNYG